jgi:hypothetical protein
VSARVAITCRKCDSHDEIPQRQAANCDITCHTCRAEIARRRRAALKASGKQEPRNRERAAEYERERNQRPEVRARRAADMARYSRDPLLRQRHEARWQVRRAIAAGRLTRKPCETCGQLNVHGHHDDYTKPLEVRWLCTACHRDWHKSNTPIYARVQGAQP